MPHVIVPNYTSNNTTELFQSVWKLTRAMLAAGWKYKASADATGASGNKDTSGSPAADKWGVGGGVNLTQVGAQTGTAPVIGAPASGVSVVTGLSGFTANSVGRFLRITGANNNANNGVFRITAQAGTSASIFHPGAVSETTTSLATWTEMQGGAGASVVTAGTGGASPGRAIVTGLTGMVAPTSSPVNRGSVGDYLTIINGAIGANNGTFRILRVISTTSVEIENSSATSVGETNNGSLIWAETSPTTQVYPGSLQGGTGTGAWLVLEGPDTLKIPIGANVPTGTFVRGEKVTQSTSGATGTLLGVLTDTATSLGFLVVSPRLNGTGGGVRGWTTGATDTVTGATSGATITTANILPVQYVREITFWKNVQASGHIYAQCVDQNVETSYRFSVIALNAAITNVLAPGSSAGPGFPLYGSYAMLGTGGAASAATSPVAWGHGGIGTVGNAQIMCANCIPSDTDDVDGSWIWALGTPTNASSSYGGMFFQRLDDTEEGDLDPYISFSPSTAAFDGVRTNSVAITAPDFWQQTILAQNSLTYFRGWRRRGFPTADAFQQFAAMYLTNGSNSPGAVTNGIWRVQHAFQETFIREPIWIISTQANQRMRKGTLRWVFATEGGISNMTYQSGKWLQLSGNTNVPCIVGPWDGLTIPTNA